MKLETVLEKVTSPQGVFPNAYIAGNTLYSEKRTASNIVFELKIQKNGYMTIVARRIASSMLIAKNKNHFSVVQCFMNLGNVTEKE